MAFTAGEITNIANSSLDWFYQKGSMFENAIQEKPLLNFMEGRKKWFPGGKGDISIGVRFAFGDGSGTNDTVKGYTHNDTLLFYTPANNMRAAFPWREHHIGLTLTHTELKIDGISVVDTNGEKTSEHSRRELHVLIGLLESKLSDMAEQYARKMNTLMYGDGVADGKALAGLKLLVSEDPSIGVVGGINRATAANAGWRNRARTVAFGAKVTGTPALGVHGGGAITSNVANGGALLSALQDEYRQATRYGGKPTKAFAGSAFLTAMETELRANGNYSMTGFSSGADVSVGSMRYMGTTFEYDPTLDDLSLSKRCYWIDAKNIFLMAMEDEWPHQHSPARPPNQMVMYRSITNTGQMVATQLNSSIVLDIT
jgi:hypothetical protein